MITLVYIVGTISGLILIYLLVIRPWHLHWGTTKKETEHPQPGDSMVVRPDFNATRGITINASPKLIWRWLIQIGSKRAGWYSIDWIDNAGIKSSTEILPQFQKIEVGQFIPFTTDQKNGMWVKEFEEYKYMLWIDKVGKATWLWYLVPTTDGRTRLLTRLKTKYDWHGFWVFYYLLYDFGDIIMMRYCLNGIKWRAESESLKKAKK